MKLKTFLTSGLLAAGAVLLYQKKDDIINELTDTSNTIRGAQNNLTEIKHNLSIIQEQEANLKNISQDLTYKFQVFNKEVQAHLSEIQKISDKYQHPISR